MSPHQMLAVAILNTAFTLIFLKLWKWHWIGIVVLSFYLVMDIVGVATQVTMSVLVVRKFVTPAQADIFGITKEKP